jgi:phospholipase/carboxylesterase
MHVVSNSEEAIIIETADQPDACIIWLHGLGADGNDFAPIIPQLGLPSSLRVRFIFPHAAVIPISINQGYRMRGWYDITSLDRVDHDEDSKGIADSSCRIADIIDSQQESGIAADRIIIAGFSQGGAIALHLALAYPDKLGGVMALSTYLPECAALQGCRHTGLNIFMAHGTEDDVVKYKFGKMSRDALISQEHAVKWHEYPMGHSLCPEQIEDISNWLWQTLG